MSFIALPSIGMIIDSVDVNRVVTSINVKLSNSLDFPQSSQEDFILKTVADASVSISLVMKSKEQFPFDGESVVWVSA